MSLSMIPGLVVRPVRVKTARFPQALIVEETGDALEHFLEPAQGTLVPMTRRRLRQAQHTCHFAIR